MMDRVGLRLYPFCFEKKQEAHENAPPKTLFYSLFMVYLLQTAYWWPVTRTEDKKKVEQNSNLIHSVGFDLPIRRIRKNKPHLMYRQLRIHKDERSSRIPVLCCEGSNFTLSEQAKMRFLNMSCCFFPEQRCKDSKK